VHSGPVSGVIDVNERANVAGAGINMAQRVMDCGDVGDILLSKHVAEDFEQYAGWKPLLHDLGECEVKHGVHVHVVNLHTDELGSTEPPEKFKNLRGKRKIGPVISASTARARGLDAASVVPFKNDIDLNTARTRRFRTLQNLRRISFRSSRRS